MTSENTEPKQHSPAKVLYRFLGGAALGALAVSIPIAYGWPIELNLGQVAIAALLPTSCGFLSILWGEKFTDTVARVLNSFGL